MAISKLVSPISETRPISKACQRVTSVIDSNISARSSEREQRILAASRSAKRALLHREREGGLNCESIYPDSVILVTYTYVCFQKLRDCLNM